MNRNVTRMLGAALCLAMAFACPPAGGGAYAAGANAADAYAAGADGTGHEVSFDLNGGEGAAPQAIKSGAGGKLGALPGGEGFAREGYEFKGWYGKSAGSLYGMMPYESHPAATAETAVSEPTTLYAAWQAKVAFVEAGAGVTLGIMGASKLLDRDGKPIGDIGKYMDGTYSDADLPIFKDLNGNGGLDAYEDWRKPVAERVGDLAGKLAADPDGVRKMAGLMLYSSHQMIMDPYVGTLQAEFLTADHLRHVLIMQADNPVDAALWTNNAQAYLEGLAGDYGIPANNSSDPRHGADSLGTAEYSLSASGISAWPSSLGLAATFDPAAMLEFGRIASAEYRLMGIATALSPQIDIATDPRWSRFNGTFGEDPKLAADMAAAYVRGFQSSYALSAGGEFGAEAAGGWGPYSVNAMIKHWPGGGAGEGGQDAHYAYGKYAVYPGGNFNAHLIPFVDGAFGAGVGPTGKATAVMPYYTISYLQVPNSEPNSSDSEGAGLNMANAYSKYMITDLLRGAYKFDGVVCTDWNVIGPTEDPSASMFGPTPGMIWGVDDHRPDIAGFGRTDRQGRADLLLRAGVNQFGGLNSIEPIMDAYEANRAEIEPFMLDSAKALLTNIFRPGLFENPYVNVGDAEGLLGGAKFVEAGYQAQLDSTVLLKNKGGLLPLAAGSKVYVPGAASGRETPATVSGAALDLIKSYFGPDGVVTDPAGAQGADAALVFGASLLFGGGSYGADGSIAFKPAAIDYKEYTAANSRADSVAGAPVRDAQGNLAGRSNNSYRGKSASPLDPIPGFFGETPSALPSFLEDVSLARDSGLPLVFSLKLTNPMALGDIEPYADAVLADFENQMAAVLDVLVGKTKNRAPAGGTVPASPKGRLPMQMPKDMETVEAQLEDVPRDMVPYADSEGNVWDFGFGLTYGSAEPLAVPAAYAGPPQAAPANPDGKEAIGNRIKVSFDYDGDGKADFIKIVAKGTAATGEVDPQPKRDGYSLAGWKDGSGAAYGFGAPVNAELALTADWKEAGAEPAPSGALPAQAGTSAWAKPYVDRLSDAGIMGARAGGAIDPGGFATFGEFADMAALALGLPPMPEPGQDGASVPNSGWMHEFFGDASAYGDSLTRQDACLIALGALFVSGAELPVPDGAEFPDSEAISEGAKIAVDALRHIGVVGGRDSGAFDPLAPITREESAKIVCGLMDYAAS
jgi:beta-glucosidase